MSVWDILHCLKMNAGILSYVTKTHAVTFNLFCFNLMLIISQQVDNTVSLKSQNHYEDWLKEMDFFDEDSLPPVEFPASSGVPTVTEVSSGVPTVTEVSSGVPTITEVSSGVPTVTEVSSLVPDRTFSDNILGQLTAVIAESPIFTLEVRREFIVNDCIRATHRKGFSPTTRVKV